MMPMGATLFLQCELAFTNTKSAVKCVRDIQRQIKREIERERDIKKHSPMISALVNTFFLKKKKKDWFMYKFLRNYKETWVNTELLL